MGKKRLQQWKKIRSKKWSKEQLRKKQFYNYKLVTLAKCSTLAIMLIWKFLPITKIKEKYILFILISLRIFFLAAHCFHDLLSLKKHEASRFIIVVGKRTKDFYKVDSSAQKNYTVRIYRWLINFLKLGYLIISPFTIIRQILYFRFLKFVSQVKISKATRTII